MRISDVLAPWEFDAQMPPRIVSFAQGSDVTIALLEEPNQERRVVFRTREDDGSWMLSKGTPFFLPHYLGRPYNANEKALLGLVAEARSSGQFCRLLFWQDADVTWRISLAPVGAGLCQALSLHRLPDSLTPFVLGHEVGEWSSSRTHSWLREQSHTPESALHFALRFHRLSREQKRAHLFGFGEDAAAYERQRGELENLMRLVLWSDVRLWEGRQELGWRIGARQGFQIYDALSHHSWNGEWQLPYLNCWAEALRRFGPLQPKAHNATLEQFWNGVEHLGQITVGPPTMHEQLEGRLELRDWGSEHLPTNVWAEIEHFRG